MNPRPKLSHRRSSRQRSQSHKYSFHRLPLSHIRSLARLKESKAMAVGTIVEFCCNMSHRQLLAVGVDVRALRHSLHRTCSQPLSTLSSQPCNHRWERRSSNLAGASLTISTRQTTKKRKTKCRVRAVRRRELLKHTRTRSFQAVMHRV